MDILRKFIVVYDKSTSKNGLVEHQLTWRKKYLSQYGVLIIYQDNLGLRRVKFHPIEDEIVNQKKGYITSKDDYKIDKSKNSIEVFTENSSYSYTIIKELDVNFDLCDIIEI